MDISSGTLPTDRFPMSQSPDPLNTALLLYMLDRAAPVYGNTKLQKTPFFVELSLDREGLAGPTFRYKRYYRGPYSQEVWDTADFLVERGFMHSIEYGGPTERGLLLLDLVEMLRPGNEETFGIMDQTLKYCRARTGKQLMDSAYEIELTPVGMSPDSIKKLRDVQQQVLLLAPLESTLEIPSDLLAIITSELARTSESIKKAKARFPESEQEGLRRLLDAIPEGLPS